MLSTQKKKREEDMYTKLERCKMKADFPCGDWGNFIRRVVARSAQMGRGGVLSTQRKREKEDMYTKLKKGQDQGGFSLGRCHNFPELVP